VHELSIASAILQLALAQAGTRRVARVGVVVGHLRQVVPQALRFSFELVSRDTPAEGAELEIAEAPAIGRCETCGVESRLTEFPLHCAACSALNITVVSGEELLVDWLDLEVPDTEEAAAISSG
jgi:hydrogenase nickel incorporation protein HypA/HybF